MTATESTDILQDGTCDIPEAMRLTGLKRTYLYELMTRGELKYAKVGKRRLIVRRSLVELLRRNLVGSN